MSPSRIEPALILSCEHGGNAVPEAYAGLFAGQEEGLASHRGLDRGALTIAKILAEALGAPLFASTVTRLLVDLNRSLGHPRLFSALSRGLPVAERQAVLDAVYHPHREAVAAACAALLAAGRPVLHLAVHSFTPSRKGKLRHCDVGFLYDPGRDAEKTFCLAWQRALAGLDPNLILRRNYPYKGVSDGLTTALRRRFGPAYRGIELEVNQRFALAGGDNLDSIAETLLASLKLALVSP